MYVIITYDLCDKTINRVRKYLKKYLIWVQNSVFEGEITEGKLYKCLADIQNMICKEDSIYIYKIKNPKNMEKNVIGMYKNIDDIFI